MSNLKYLIFSIMFFSSLFGGIGDLLDIRSGASHHGNGYTLNTVFPFIAGSFTENPVNVAHEGNAAFMYSQFFPAGGALFDINGRHAIGSLSAEFPIFNYFACGISYGYSSFVDDNNNITGAPLAGGTEGGSLKNVEMVVNTTFLFTTYPKRPKGDIVKRGEQIGELGTTGLATGPHLHWELRVGMVCVDGTEILSLPNEFFLR